MGNVEYKNKYPDGNLEEFLFPNTQVFRWWLQLLSKMDAAEELTGNVVPCKNAPDLFFPDDVGTSSIPEEARRACNKCPIQDACATYAVIANERHGLWGGTSSTDRKRIRKDVIANGLQVWFAQNGYFAYRKHGLQANREESQPILWSHEEHDTI